MQRTTLTHGLAALLLATLAACGGSSDEGNLVIVDGISMDKTIDKTGTYDVDVAGARNDVTIAPNNKVGRLIVTGANNRIYVKKPATVNQIELVGNGNTVYVPIGFKAPVHRSGNNNDVVERD